MNDDENNPPPNQQTMDDNSSDLERRSFLSKFSSLLMMTGLAASYGTFATLMGWFLFPVKPLQKSWMFVTDLNSISAGQSLTYRSPIGQTIVITRLSVNGNAEDFIALSSVCPHLGCQVHWESQNDRFFCPCHNGVFNSSGLATSGPPAEAGQSLARYPLMVERGLLFIEVPTESLTHRTDSFPDRNTSSHQRMV